MVDLLNDKSVGFGDDFSFIKSQMLNWIYPEHLRDLDMSVNPAIFYHYDLAEARRVFNQYHNTWFKALYFSLAPLLAIPLYQQHRSHTDIYKDVHDRRAAFWEHEAIANFHGEDVFCHPDSITRNILKTECTAADEDSATLAVTAYGFSGHERTDHISVRGGDGHTHDVPVHWLEYLPVQRTTPLVLRETENLSRKAFAQQSHGAADWQAFFQKGKIDPQHAFFRRSIVSGIPSSEK
ncbi:MAG: hypothetical protein LBF51_04305 [Zoogloeaceae bacterium]|nr:hypothetical protein [Zoogloeaceae bacterium]